MVATRLSQRILIEEIGLDDIRGTEVRGFDRIAGRDRDFVSVRNQLARHGTAKRPCGANHRDALNFHFSPDGSLGVDSSSSNTSHRFSESLPASRSTYCRTRSLPRL